MVECTNALVNVAGKTGDDSFVFKLFFSLKTSSGKKVTG